MEMGRLLISISEADEALIRECANEDFGGKKGAISTMIAEAVHDWVRRKMEQKARNKAADRLMALMTDGMALDLKGGKAYEKREDIYAERLRKQGMD
ncbi:hypothetical protein HY994_00710 [Candidatus Micrarchaeota archaeon]|nr:hypothetical protein [Candidatus Micrarchaeota archaeon]